MFVLALTEKIYLPLQLMTIFFLVEFGIRVTAGIQYQLGVRGALPATLCSICLTLMLDGVRACLCAGCELYAFLRRRGWIAQDDAIEIGAGGVCEVPRPAAVAVER